MNPAFSVILLTTASGGGYGMLFWLGVLTAIGVMPLQPSFGIPAIFIALILCTIGLLASTAHLGHPERAWRAVSQWRSSWLSREGVLSLLTYIPALAFAAAWWFAGPLAVATIVLGLVAAVLGMLTVFSQSMIYASLKPIRQWHNNFVPPVILLLALASGAACLAAMTIFWALPGARAAAAIAVALCLIAMAVKLSYWRFIDTTPSSSHHRVRLLVSAPSARCASSNVRTPRKTICCAKWAMRSAANTPTGYAPSPSRPASLSLRSCSLSGC